MFKKTTNSNAGFTLVELVVIIVILGILAAVAIPKLFSVTQEAEEASVANMLASLESASLILANARTASRLYAARRPQTKACLLKSTETLFNTRASDWNVVQHSAINVPIGIYRVVGTTPVLVRPSIGNHMRPRPN